MSASANFALPVGCRGRLLHDPQWHGEVIGFDGDAALVAFRVGEQIATGKHNPAALERIEP